MCLPSTPHHLTDPELAEALMAGHAGAARLAWARFAPVVRRILARRWGQHDLDDLVQEVFCSLFQAVTKLRNPLALRSLVRVIAVRKARAERRRRASALTSAPNVTADFTENLTSATSVQAQYSIIRLFRIIGCLREHERRAFVLRFLEGKSTEETARCTDVSIATARRRLRRAEMRIQFLAEHDLFLSDYTTSGSGEG